jgi:hypothetical protein
MHKNDGQLSEHLTRNWRLALNAVRRWINSMNATRVCALVFGLFLCFLLIQSVGWVG